MTQREKRARPVDDDTEADDNDGTETAADRERSANAASKPVGKAPRARGKEDADDDEDADDKDEDAEDDADDDEDADDKDEDDADDDEDADDKDEDAEDDADDDEDADDKDEDAEDDADDDEKAVDERAGRVARSLGVVEDDGAEAGGEAAARPVPKNRAERRRERALSRRTGRATGDDAGTADDDDDDDVAADEPRDRNRKLREEFLRKRKATAEAQKEDARQGLAASEMVDDALARGTSAVTKWLRRSWRWLRWALLASAVGGLFTWWYLQRSGSSDAKASDELYRAVALEQSMVGEDKRDDEDKKKAPVTIYATADERANAIAEAYAKVAAKQGASGTGLLAKLGEAGALLEARKWDDAIAAYDSVLASKLAAADVDVKARALEGKGFALEGKKDLDGAVAAFKQLEALAGPDALGSKELAALHQARVLVAKGDKNAAKELLVTALKDLDKANLELAAADQDNPIKPYRWLPRALERSLRAIDPSAVPAKPAPQLPGGKGGAQIPQELLDKLSPEERKKFEDMMKGGGVPPGAPPMQDPQQGPPE